MPAAEEGENVIRLDSAQEALKRHFLGWQCRLRQHAMRKNGGRPSSGMCPSVEFGEEGSARAELVILISQKDSSDATAKFRHMVRKTHDPKERLDGVVKELSAAYFQYPEEFSDVMTALFGPTSGIADRLVAAGRGILRFDQYSQKYTIPCRVDLLAEADSAWQATFWHNSLFNPKSPAVRGCSPSLPTGPKRKPTRRPPRGLDRIVTTHRGRGRCRATDCGRDAQGPA